MYEIYFQLHPARLPGDPTHVILLHVVTMLTARMSMVQQDVHAFLTSLEIHTLHVKGNVLWMQTALELKHVRISTALTPALDYVGQMPIVKLSITFPPAHVKRDIKETPSHPAILFNFVSKWFIYQKILLTNTFSNWTNYSRGSLWS